MQKLYDNYGYFREGLDTLTCKGIDGAEQIKQRMESFRNGLPKEIGGLKVLAMRDYKTGERLDIETGEKTPTGVPESNVLYYELDDHSWCCVRPSGTEPKIKFYYGVRDISLEGADERFDMIRKDLVEEV